MTFILGPAVCRNCRRNVYLDVYSKWCDPSGKRHLCGRAWYTKSCWFRKASTNWTKAA